MSADHHRIDLLVQFALLIAGEEDDGFDRELGPIHLIKYVYLADLAYARRNKGETFTGTAWTFHKFGPWSQAVNERIEPALSAVGAEHRQFESNYGGDDWHRWSLRSEQRLDDIRRQLPPAVTTAVRQSVRNHGKDTPSLLHYVYRTPPMLTAAPGEALSFSEAYEDANRVSGESPQKLSTKKLNKLKNGLAEIRSRMAKNPDAGRVPTTPVTPNYDAIYEQGLAWLDSDAGSEFEDGEITAQFDESVWKSEARKPIDDNLP